MRLDTRTMEKTAGRSGMRLICAFVAAAILVPVAPAALFAQSGRPAAAADASRSVDVVRLITLGTGGGPLARAHRSQPANLLQIGDRSYLIDVGDGTSQALVRSGAQPGDVSKIFITHLHQDHVGGLAPLLAFNLMVNRGTPVDIYGPPRTKEFVANALRYLAIPVGIHAAQGPWVRPANEIVFSHEVDAGGPAVVYCDDQVRVTAVDNSHFVTFGPGERPVGAARSYAYRFDTPGRSIVFTGDSGPSDAIVSLARGADILVSEVQDLDEVLALVAAFPGSPETKAKLEEHMRKEHLSPEEVGDMARRAGVKMVVLTHFGARDEVKQQRLNLAQRTRSTFRGPVVEARDGSIF